MPEEWSIDCGSWSEVWSRSGNGAFENVAVGKTSFAIGREDLAAFDPTFADGCPVCRAGLPRVFAFCFACGSNLEPLHAKMGICQNVPNAGSPQVGLPALTIAGGAAVPNRVALPAVGKHFAFAVAGQPTRLFAIDRDGGWVHEFDRLSLKWRQLFGIGENLLPDRSWSLAAACSGLVIPAHGRLNVVDLASGPLPRPIVERLPPGDVCVGGACIVQQEACVPVLRAGVLHLARRSMLTDAVWSFEAVQHAPVFSGDLARMLFSAPIATGNSVSWSGETGTIVALPVDDGTPGPSVWREWRGGFAPLLEHRPYADPDGGVWQFGTIPGQNNRQNFCFERIGSSSQAAHVRLTGSVLASGILSCKMLTLRNRAWVEDSPYNRNLPGHSDDYLVPIQAINSTNAVLIKASDRLSDLVSAGGEGISPAIPSTVLFFDGNRPIDLAITINLASLSQVSAFVFDNHLFVYDARENECSRWLLSAAD